MGKRKREHSPGRLLQELREGCDVHRVKRLVQKHGLDVNHQDADGLSALMVACQRGNLRIVKFLLTRTPARAGAVDANKETALHHAGLGGLSRRRLGLVQYLVTSEACQPLLDRRNLDNTTPRTLFRELLQASEAQARTRARDHADGRQAMMQLTGSGAGSTPAGLASAAASLLLAGEGNPRGQDEWQEKLSNAMSEDVGDHMGTDAWSSAWGEEEVDRRGAQDVSRMTDEEYRRFMVSGMRERHGTTAGSDPSVRRARAVAAKRAEEERRREEARVESERIIREQLAETERKRRARAARNADHYSKRCAAFFDQRSQGALEPGSVPLAAVPFPVMCHPDDMVAQDIAMVVLAGIDVDAQRKHLLKEQRRWHPDKWGAQMLEAVVEADREDVLARVRALSRILNQLRAEYEAKGQQRQQQPSSPAASSGGGGGGERA